MILVIIRDLSLPLLSQSLLFSDSAWGPFLLERREVQGKAGRHKKSKNRRRDIYFRNKFEEKGKSKFQVNSGERNQNIVNPTKKKGSAVEGREAQKEQERGRDIYSGVSIIFNKLVFFIKLIFERMSFHKMVGMGMTKSADICFQNNFHEQKKAN